MRDLNEYLTQHFVNAERFAEICRLSQGDIRDLIRERLIPKPSYVISNSQIHSYVFGSMPAGGAAEGEYFRPEHAVWVAIARQVLERTDRRRAHDELKRRFSENLARALRDLDRSTWRLRDSFADDGSPIEHGLASRVDGMWTHFLEGTYGLCVSDPTTEAAIARKEVLQEMIVELSDNGARKSFSSEEARTLLLAIEAYSEAAMPFSPVEDARSSRKRLVDDLSARIRAQADRAAASTQVEPPSRIATQRAGASRAENRG